MFPFGGCTKLGIVVDNKKCIFDAYCFCWYMYIVASHTWMRPSLRGEGPDAREGHSAALVGKRLFVFGGCGKSSSNEEVYYNDLYVLNTGNCL